MTKDMMTSFNFKNMDVRVFTKNNVHWFVLNDVCEILEFHNPCDAFSILDEDKKNIFFISTISGSPKTMVINKKGLYRLVLRSRKPEAEQFNKWVKSEVLPSLNHKPTLGDKDMLDNSILFDFESTSIRVFSINDEAWFSASDVAKALGYKRPADAIRSHCKGVGETKTLTTGGYMVSIPNETPEQILSRALLLAKDTMDRQTQEIAELKPKADGYDLIATSEGSMCITDTAKYLQIRPKELFDYLKT